MKRCLIAAIVAVLALASISSDAVSQENSDSYNVGGVSLRMTQPPGSVLNPGDEIGFRLQSDENAYVIVFNIDTEGYVNLLYPAKGERPVHVREGESYIIPDESNEMLIVEGRTGVEFVFVLVVPERDDIDRRELDYLGKANDLPDEERYRIDGDPFIAANIIAGELVRGISRREGIYLDYTYFFINERVAYPCYLCGECDGLPSEGDCGDFIVAANFEAESLDRPLSYPLPRGYEMIEPVATPMLEDDAGMAVAQGDDGTFGQYSSDDGTVNINFYPYNSEVYYETRETLTKGTDVDVYVYGRDPYWYDPWYYGWYYYPTVSVGFYWGSPSFSWGFNWGCWGGYYCSAWYWPRCYTVYDNYAYYGGGNRYRPERYKDKYYAGDTGGGADPYKNKYKSAGAYQTAYAAASKRDSRMKLTSRSASNARGATKSRSGSIESREKTIARGTKAIGKSTRIRNFGTKSASGAKYANKQKTRTSYTPRTRKSYGVSAPNGGTRGKAGLKPRTGTSRSPAYKGTATSRNRNSTRTTYQRSAPRGGKPNTRSTTSRGYRSPSSRSTKSGVRSSRPSGSSRSKSGYKPSTRSSRPSNRSAVKSGRSSSRPSGKSSSSGRSSGGRSRSSGKGRK